MGKVWWWPRDGTEVGRGVEAPGDVVAQYDHGGLLEQEEHALARTAAERMLYVAQHNVRLENVTTWPPTPRQPTLKGHS